MNRLDELEGKLAAEVAAMKVSEALEATLLREFDRRRRRVLWLLPIAAMLAATVWLMPRDQQVVPPQPAPFAAAAPAPVPVVPVKKVHTRRRKAAKPAPPDDDQPEFIRIPFSAPLGPYERAEIIRTEIPVSALTAAGIQVATADTGAKAQADLVVGEDGMAHAVRLISISSR